MSTQNQPTIKAIRDEYTAYAIGEGGALSYLRWVECRAVNLQARLDACEECIADMASDPGPKGREIW